MKYLLNLKKMPYFHLWVLAFFYLPQSIIGFYKYELPYAFLFISIALTSIFSYLFFLKFIFSNQKFTSMIKNINKLAFDVGSHSYFIFTLYFALILYAILTSEQIPLFMVFKGASIDELAQNREMFLRTREGWESVIPYINAFFIMALIPYSLTSLFYTKHKLRFHFLGLFLFCLALTLEKSVAVLAIVPIIILMVNTQKNNKFFRLIIFLIMFIAAVSFLSRGGASSQNEELVGGANAIPENYQLFTGQSQLHYIANRIFWIPYATAIDWLKFQDSVLGGKYVLGSSVGIIASVTGVPKINLERDVFEFQWGQNATGTGSSNTVYFIDAYVNFSWFGVILYAAVLALIVRILAISNNIPIKCVFYISLFYLCINSLPPMIFSGGLILIVPIAMFMRQKSD